MLTMHPILWLPFGKPTESQPADAPGCYYYRRRSAARPRNFNAQASNGSRRDVVEQQQRKFHMTIL
eukprot:scaffold400774_cov27-Prasinocladus_malaysianus.AAC.1